MHLNRNQITDIIKVLSATILLTTLFLWGSQKTGEQANEQYFEDYLNQPDTVITGNINTGIHEVSTIPTIEAFCASKQNICAKIDFIGDFINEQKTNYLEKEDKITSFIDKNNAQKKDFLSSLTTMQINENEGKRGYATHDKVVINIGNILSDDEFNQISTHELGHIADLGFLQGDSETKDKTYTEFNKAVFAINDPSVFFYKLSRDNETIRKATAKKQNFCSVYGMSDPFEDFAECFNLYINHNKLFKFWAQKDPILGRKFNFLASMFKGKYINADIQNISTVKDKTGERVWDTTKIAIK
ncbi:MAG: hypothetical protein WCO66_02885 [Candidatus Absconditabacteria bacterium]